MNATQTPGPWRYQPSAGNHDYLVYAEATGRDVAIVRDFNEADARLIAAAPALRDKLAAVACYCPVAVQDAIRVLLGEIDGKAAS